MVNDLAMLQKVYQQIDVKVIGSGIIRNMLTPISSESIILFVCCLISEVEVLF